MNHIRRIGTDGGLRCTALNVCHPERSLVPSEARSQTESKDPYSPHGGRGDARSFRIAIRFFDDHDTEVLHDSSREAETWESPARHCRANGEKRTSPAGTAHLVLKSGMALSLTFILFASQLLSAQAYARFPGSKSQLFSPNGRYVIQNVDQEPEPQHAILLKDRVTGRLRKVYEYGRGASVVWSPDSRHFAVNDYAGSDYTETSIFSVDKVGQKIDVQDAIFQFDQRMQRRVNLVGWGHDYFGVVHWLDQQRVVVRHWGHNDEPPLGEFCDCYIYTLRGSVLKCAHQPKSGDPETFCGNTTP